jgi:hypothetical protein
MSAARRAAVSAEEGSPALKVVFICMHTDNMDLVPSSFPFPFIPFIPVPVPVIPLSSSPRASPTIPTACFPEKRSAPHIVCCHNTDHIDFHRKAYRSASQSWRNLLLFRAKPFGRSHFNSTPQLK